MTKPMLFLSHSRNGARRFVNTSRFDDRALPVPPSEILPTLKDHVYDIPTNHMETTSFSPNADVIPRLGTLTSQKNRNVDITASPKPVPVSIPQPGQMAKEEEDFYDDVYDDGYDRPRPIGEDLREKAEEARKEKKAVWPYSSVSSSMDVETENTGAAKFEDDFTKMSLQMSPQRSSEMAANPLYDPFVRNTQ